MKAKKSSKNSKNNEASLRALTAFLIFCVGAGVFLIFYNFKDKLLSSSDAQPFILLSVLLGGFLIGLLYLLNPKR